MTIAAQTRVVLQVCLILASVIVAVWAAERLVSVLVVLILAGLFAYLVAPLVHLAERPIRIAGRSRRFPRGAAIGLVYLLLAGSAIGGGALLLPGMTRQVDAMMAEAPAYAQSTLGWEHGWVRYYEHLQIPREIRDHLDQSMAGAGGAVVDSVRASALGFAERLSNLPWLLLVPILAFFFLRDAGSIRRAVVTGLPHRIRLRGHRLFEELNATLAAYVRAQLLACLLVGTLCGIGFALLGIPYAMLLGALAGVLEFIPLVGPLLLAIVASAVGALQAPMLAFAAVGFLAVLRLVQDYVIYPRLIGRGVSLHPLAVIVAVLAGAELAGVAGAFLAVPTVAIAVVLVRHGLTWGHDVSAET